MNSPLPENHHTCGECGIRFNLIRKRPSRAPDSSICHCGRRYYMGYDDTAKRVVMRMVFKDLQTWRSHKSIDLNTLKWFGKCKGCGGALAGEKPYDYCGHCRQARNPHKHAELK